MAKRLKKEPLASAQSARGAREADSGLPDSATVKAHVAELNELKAKGAEINGSIGALTKNGEEQHNIHRGALKLVAKLERMDESKRSEFLLHFEHYLSLLGLEAQPQLFEGSGAAATMQ